MQNIMALRSFGGRNSGLVRIASGKAYFTVRGINEGRAYLLFRPSGELWVPLCRTPAGASAEIAFSSGRPCAAAVSRDGRTELVGASRGGLGEAVERMKKLCEKEKNEKEKKDFPKAVPVKKKEAGDMQGPKKKEAAEQPVFHAAQKRVPSQDIKRETVFANAFPRAYPRINWRITEKGLRAEVNGRKLFAYPAPIYIKPPAGLPENVKYALCRNGQGYL